MGMFSWITGMGKSKDEMDSANPNMEVFADLSADDIDVDDLAVTATKTQSHDMSMSRSNQDYYYNRIYTPTVKEKNHETN